MSLLLLLCVGAISGCGALAPSPTARAQQPLPAIAHPFHATMKTLDGAFIVALDITPNRSGPNVFMVQVRDSRTGKPATPVAITLYFTMQDMPMGTDSITLHVGGSGLFSATSNDLSMGGHWAISMTIQTPDQRIHKAGVRVLTS